MCVCTKANSGMPFFERNFTFCQSSFHFLFGRVEGRLKTTQWCSYLLSSQSAGSRGAVLDGAAGLRSAVGSCWWAQRAPEGPRAPSGGGAVNAGAAAAQFPPETPPGPQSRQQQPALAFQRRQPPGRGRRPQVFLGARAAHAQNSPSPNHSRRSAGAPCCVSARAVSTQRRGNSVGPSDGRRVNLRRLRDQPWVCTHWKSQLLGNLDLVGEGSRREAAGKRSGSWGRSELEPSSLASVPGGQDPGTAWFAGVALAQAPSRGSSQGPSGRVR